MTVHNPGRLSTSDSQYYHGGVLHRIASVRCASDTLPTLFHTIVTNGKSSAAALLGVYLMLLSLFVPFWLLSFLVTEWGIYIAAIGSIFLIGRSIIRMIAFPGASRRIVTEIEKEFAKYSVRMIEISCNSICELASLFEPREQVGEAKLDKRVLQQLPGVWRRVKDCRDRVLGVYVDVLRYIYQQDSAFQLHLSETLDHTQNNALTTSADRYGPGLTRFGNNRLMGDVGDVSSLPSKARTDGRDLLERLEKLVLFIDDLEMKAKPALNEGSSVVTEQTRVAAGKMKDSASELRDFVSSLKPPDDDSTESSGEEPLDSVGRNMEEQQAKGNVIEIAKNTIGSILPMLDPPSNESIFGLDVQRGCMLSRYHFSRQLWIHRPTGGMIDVLHFPAVRGNQLHPELVAKNSKAVLYCNPNAGLIEIATGMSLTGGNLPHSEPGTNVQDDCWVDYYTALGMDVYVFNYAGYGRSFGGYGRSFGTTMCVSTQGTQGDLRSGFLSRMARIVRSTLLAFQPTPDTLRADGVTVAKHLLSEGGVNHLYIHGESIGGVAASGTARYLSQTALSTKLSMLICDRTFCNLEAIAQRLVGEWSGYAIAFLTPAWNTDVAGDFLAASCPKVIASDAADAIIAEPSSLKAGVALWKELHRGASSTKRIGWVPETPLQYRMADWENCCVNDSRFISKDSLFHAQPPTWPRDKHLSVEETFHFAACCKRIGRLATQVARASAKQIDDANTQANVDLHQQPLVVQAWAVLGGCDGLTGATLGVATKRGFDATVTWLCASVVYGGQVVIEKAEERMHQRQGSASGVEVLPSDFDNRPPGFELLERDGSISFPKPIPVVVELLVSFLEVGDPNVAKLSHEFQFAVGVLHYIVSRLSASSTVQAAQQSRRLDGFDDTGAGVFLNLSCGHNNPFSKEEKLRLEVLLNRSASRQNDEVV